MKILVILLVLIGISGADIIDASRVPQSGDWQGVGVAGGIPPRTQTVFASVKDAPYSATGDGVANDYTAVSSAISACPVGEVVYFPAGTYYMGNNQIRITKGVILRGEDPDTTTILSDYSDYSGAVAIYQSGITTSYDPEYVSGVETSITAGATKGSTLITVASTTNMVVGNWLMVAGENPDVINTNNDENDADSWSPAAGYMTKIVGISGNDITLADPLPWEYTCLRAYLNGNLDESGDPQAAVFYKSGASVNFVEGAGIEDLAIDPNGGTTGVGFWFAANCWMDNCEIYDATTRNVYVAAAANITITGSYVHDTRGDGSGGGYGVLLEGKATNCLIENNRFNMNASAVLVDDGAYRTVVAYNYIHDFKFFQSNWQVQQLNHHRAHPMFTLYEGNWAPNAIADDIHGSNSHWTVFRNRLHGKQDENRTNQLWVVGANRNSLYLSSVGNILGTAGVHDTYMQDHTTGILYATEAIYTLGFANFHFGAEGHDPDAKSTAYIHGDYDVVTDGVTWDAGNADHTIPNSLYLTAKPSWFGSLDWPAYDSASPSLDEPARIPAGYRYLNGEGAPAQVKRKTPQRKVSGVLVR